MMRRRLARALGRLTWQRVLLACVVALVAWLLARHAPYWLAREFAPYWSAAPKHWIAANPESKFSDVEGRVAAALALLAGTVAFFRPRSDRAATGTARWLYDRMAGGIVRLLLVAVPTALVWFLARAAIHALFFPAMHHPPTASDRGTELAFTALVTYLAGSIVMVWQAVWNAEWRWSEGVAQRENVSPTFLRLASGITSGPFDIPTRPGCGPTLLLGVLALPFFLPWLCWRLLMAAGELLGGRWLLGRFLAARQATVYDLATGSRLRTVDPRR